MSDTPDAPAKLITAIVCTHNRYDVLPDALTSLSRQTLDRSLYEILVVDNSTDIRAQKGFWRRYLGRFDVTLEIAPEPGLSKARNTGIALATAPIVAFCDDDAVVSPGWLASLVSVFQADPDVGIAGGPVVPVWPTAAPPWLHPWLDGYFTIVDRGDIRRQLTEQEWLAGTNVAFRRDPLRKIGGFDENLGRRGKLLLSNEELDVTRKLRAEKLTVVYEPTAIVHHKVHADRVDPAWLRRRIAWQVISDAMVPATDQNDDDKPCWDKISNYLLSLPPEMRTYRGLFLDTDDPVLFQRQCEAIGSLMRFMLTQGHDLESALK